MLLLKVITAEFDSIFAISTNLSPSKKKITDNPAPLKMDKVSKIYLFLLIKNFNFVKK